MLARFLRSLFARRPDEREDQVPILRQERMRRAHQQAPMDAHLRIAFDGLRIAGEPAVELVRRCLADSDTRLPHLKALHRPLASYFLASYYLHALRLGGARAECGVFQGTSALLLCRAARAADAGHRGAGLHLVDSFQGLSEPGQPDLVDLPGSAGGSRHLAGAGALAGSLDTARRALAEFPEVTFHPGWIPQVFAELPDTRWSFVHADVDLYGPTYAVLEYFYPRLLPDGVIICDDYGSPTFPGAYRAWNRYCDEQGIPFVVLDTGQSVILKR